MLFFGVHFLKRRLGGVAFSEFGGAALFGRGRVQAV